MLPIRDSARVAGKETKSDDAKSRCSENHSNLYFNLISQFFQRLSGLFMKVFFETFFVKNCLANIHTKAGQQPLQTVIVSTMVRQ